jgi:HK97 family phage major capsid protein/HK97 family phage prohead protease
MMRAYSLLTIKSIDEDKREFVGVATTPTPDRVGDIVEPKGAQFQLPIPLLWQHDLDRPIGHVLEARVADHGIEVRCKVATINEPGTLQDRLNEAWQMLKSRLVRGLSIRLGKIKTERINGTDSIRWQKWHWFELSVVTVPQNVECSITTIKAADDILRAASGANRIVRLKLPGASGITNPKGTEMNIAEQLAAFDTKRKAAIDGMEAIMNKSAEEGRTLDEHETEQYDGMQADVKSIDAHISRLQEHEKVMVAKAAAVTPDAGRGQGGVEIPGSVISVRRNVPKGTAFTRYTMALAAAKGNLLQAEVLSKRWADSTPEVAIVMKAAVDAGTTSDTTWAAPLVQYTDMVSEFIELLRAQAVLGRMSLRRVPFNIRIPRQTSGTTGAFVGEGAPTPVKELAFDNITLPWAKASTIVVLTAELARLSSPSAEALVRQDLLNGIAEFLDKRLLDPAYPGVANISPASLTNGVTARAASGATLAAIDADVKALLTTFTNANLTLTSGMWIMSPALAITLSLIRLTQDAFAFPGLGVNGGTFYGLPAITSNNVAPSGSPGDQHLILVDQNEVLLADDGQMMIDVSTEASVQMDNAPSAGAQSLVSLWQNGLLGVKVDRWIYWGKRRSQAVQFIDGAQSYGS